MNKKRTMRFFHLSDYKRLVGIAFFVFFLFCFLIIQFYKIQIIDGNKWEKQAKAQHSCMITEPFMRGSFISYHARNKTSGQPFVMDVPKFHLFIDPSIIPLQEKETVAREIFRFFTFSEEKKKLMISKFYKKNKSRKLIPWVDPEQKSKIETWWLQYRKKKKIAKNAIFFVKDYKRSYPFGSLLGQVLHTVQEEKDKDFQSIPTGGLELYFNQYLKGKLGFRQIVRSPRNALDTKNVIQSPENGADIYLTIDSYIQAIVEKELEKGVKKANAKGGWAVMMDPQTGYILALAQYPFFDVEHYAAYFNDPKKQEHTRVKALADAFEPGSIMKPLTLAICLQANRELKEMGKAPLFSPIEKVDTLDGNFPGRKKPIKDGRQHAYLNMYLAIQKSSNIYVGRLVDRLIQQLGNQWYQHALEGIFDFGKKTRLELPGETLGFVPSYGKTYHNGKPQWCTATPYSLAMGYNILVNSIQMLRAYGILANYGKDVCPTLLRKIVKKEKDGTEKIIFDAMDSMVTTRRLLEKEDVAQIINAMKFTTKRGGTARRGDIFGFTEAGKTGTSEKMVDGRYSDDLHISSFIGFAPAKDAKFVLLVVIDEPEKRYIPHVGRAWYGGYVAAPIFQKIGMRTLEYLGVAPDDPFGYSSKDPRYDRNKADWSYEVDMMQKLYEHWNRG